MASLDLQAALFDSWSATPFPEQEAAYRDLHRDVAMFAGVRGGKSRIGAEKTAARIWFEIATEVNSDPSLWNWSPLGDIPMVSRDTPRKKYWVVAPTYTLVNESWVQLRSALSRIEESILYESDGVIWLRTGVLIERRTGSDERQLQAAKLAGCWVDEVCTLPYASYLQIRNRLVDLEGWLIATGSPRPNSWARDVIYNKGTSGVTGVHLWTTIDNPHIPRDEIERAREELAHYWFCRDYLASWEAHPALVFPEWSPIKHVVQPEDVPTDGMVYYGAQDWGYAAPGCFLLLGHHRPSGRLYAVEEIYTDRLPVVVEEQANYEGTTWVSLVKPYVEEYKLRQVWTDVSDGNKSTLAYRRAGIPAVVATKGKILDGIKTMSRLMQGETPVLQVSSACGNLINELGSFCFKILRNGMVLEEVDPDCSDHACFVGETLVATPSGPRTIKSFVDEPGVVYCWDGEKLVLAPAVGLYQGKRPVGEFAGEVCTPDHRWLSDSGEKIRCDSPVFPLMRYDIESGNTNRLESHLPELPCGAGGRSDSDPEEAYDLSVLHPGHNFVLESGFVVSNCDPLRYAVTSLFGNMAVQKVSPPKPEDNPVNRPFSTWTQAERNRYLKNQKRLRRKTTR